MEDYLDRCPVCGHDMYVGDPPASGNWCENPNCSQCPDFVHDRLEEQEQIENYQWNS